jgi:di/tricarboxylate transporter
MVPEQFAPWVVALVVAAAVFAMILGAAADVAMLGALLVLAILGLVTASQAVSGFSNEGMLTVAVLYVVVAGLQSTGAIRRLTSALTKPVAGERRALLRLCIPVALTSAFLNNTPIVAVMIPVVTDWAKRLRMAPSRLLMPLSFATILGGTITLIGTSTNLVVYGLVERTLRDGGGPEDLESLGFFDFAWIGVPVAIVGIAYIVLVGPLLLPKRQRVLDPGDDVRRYTARLLVAVAGPLDGRSIEDAGLRHLPGLFVVEVERGADTIPAPGPETILRGGDVIVLAGVLESVRELLSMRGLTTADAPSVSARSRTLVEAVVSSSYPGLGKSIRDFGFRRRYDAAVLAVARDGERVPGRIGDVVPQPGDTLLIQSDPGFVERWRDSRDFFLVGRIDGSEVPEHSRAWIAIVILALMIATAIVYDNMLAAASLAAAALLVTRCTTPAQARSSFDLSTLLVIAAGLGISRAVETSGLGAIVGSGFVQLAGGSPLLAVAATYLATMLFTALVSNSAAAAIMYPIALGAAAAQGGGAMPLVMAIVFAASADFATPIGYQTNLMIYGPGGYRFTDYLRFGAPLNLVTCIVTTTAISVVYGVPF